MLSYDAASHAMPPPIRRLILRGAAHAFRLRQRRPLAAADYAAASAVMLPAS